MSVTRQSGDTIVEVLLAVTVFSMIAVGALTIMNQSINMAQRAVEITQVKQQIDSQAEALRAAHQAYFTATDKANTVWKAIPTTTSSMDSSMTATDCPADASFGPSSVFAMNPRTGDISNKKPKKITATTKVQQAGVWYASNSTSTVDEVNSIWIEAGSSGVAAAGAPTARDFRIRACWSVPGTNVVQTTETIVRLYEPQ